MNYYLTSGTFLVRIICASVLIFLVIVGGHLRSHTTINLLDVFRLKLEEGLKVEQYQFLREYIFS